MQFIILHGSFGNQSENWFSWLKKKLEDDGHTVFAKDFPIEDWDAMTKAGRGNWLVKNQNLYKWSTFYHEQIETQVDWSQPVGVIAHSLAPLFLLNLLQDVGEAFSFSIFVAPFYEQMDYDDWQVEAVNFPFHESKFDWKQIRKRAGKSYVLYSENDPYVNSEYSLNFSEKIEASTIEFKNAGHFNSDAGWTEAPLIYELCRGQYDA